MSFDKAAIRSLVQANIGSHGTPDRAGGIDNIEMDKLIDDAAVYYSRFSPDVALYDITGDGSAFDFAVPTDWSDTFSSMLSVEYPQGSRVPEMLGDTDVTIYLDDTGQVIRFLYTTPALGDVARVAYTRPRVIGTAAADTTVPDSDKEAIGHLATHFAAVRLAAEMAKIVPSALRDDPLSLRASVAEYERMARRHWELFADHMGIPAEGSKVTAVSGHSAPDDRMSWGMPPFTHGPQTQRIFRR